MRCPCPLALLGGSFPAEESQRAGCHRCVFALRTECLYSWFGESATRRGDEACKVACFLPLTVRDPISHRLGHFALPPCPRTSVCSWCCVALSPGSRPAQY